MGGCCSVASIVISNLLSTYYMTRGGTPKIHRFYHDVPKGDTNLSHAA